MKKLVFMFLALLVAFPAYASVAIDDNGTYEGEASNINFSTGFSVSYDGSKATVTASGSPVYTGDVTFRTNLLAIGRYNGGSLTLQSSSTPVTATQLAYSVIQKRIGGAGGLDETDGGTRLANGTPGQVISLIAIYREGSGTWIITPATKTGFSTITMDAVGEHATLLYVNDTLGWIIQGSNATIA